MATVVTVSFAGKTLADHDEVHEHVMEDGLPEGLIFHTAYEDGNDLKIVDLWEDAEDFERFVEHQLTPLLEELDFDAHPEVEMFASSDIYSIAAGQRV